MATLEEFVDITMDQLASAAIELQTKSIRSGGGFKVETEAVRNAIRAITMLQKRLENVHVYTAPVSPLEDRVAAFAVSHQGRT